MGQIVYSRTVTGTLGLSYSYSDGTTSPISNGSVNDHSIAAATWTDILSTASYAANEWHLALINKGANAAVYRINIGANYWRFNLPAGKSVKLTGGGGVAGAGNSIILAVYSTAGTDIQVGFFY